MENQHEHYEGTERRKQLSDSDLAAIKHQLYESIQEDIGRGFSQWAWNAIKKGVSLVGTALVVLVCAVIAWAIVKGESLVHGVFK